MDLATLIGFAAAICTTGSFFPQAIKVVRTKHTKDLSLAMYLIMMLGMGLWLTYGILLNDAPIIAANTVSITVALVIVGHKLKYG